MAQDYIMRMIEQIGRMLAAIIAHRKAGRNADAALEIEASCLQSVGLPIDLVRRSSPEALWELLEQGGGLRYSRAVMLAELLLQDAELSNAAGRPGDAIRCKLQAFCLLADSVDVLSHEDTAIYRPRLEALAGELEAFSNDPYLREKICLYRSKQMDRR